MSEISPETSADRSSEVPIVTQLTKQQKKERIIREALDYAANNNLNPFIDYILSGELEVDQMDSRGYTALHLAVWKLDVGLVLKLLDKAGCPVDLQSGSGQTPLMLAVVKGNLELIKLFLNRGADIDAKDSIGVTPLICAVQSGQLASFYILLHRGASVEALDKNGCNVSHWAAYKNQVTMLRALKKMGHSLDSIDSLKMTCLHRAAMSNAVDSVGYLLFNKINADACDSKGRTAMEVAKDTQSEGAYRAINDFFTSNSPIHEYFSYVFFLYWVGTYYVYYTQILPYTVDYIVIIVTMRNT